VNRHEPFNVLIQRINQRIRQDSRSILITFPTADIDKSLIEAEVLHPQSEQFVDQQSGQA
jgi:hypothetical protein